MARYRKIDPRIWNDEKFRMSGDAAKLVFLFLLTHPFMTALGAMRATIAGLAEELGWQAEAFREAFREVLAKGMAEHDPKACLVALPNFIKYNQPESPNVIKAWVGALDLLPECGLKTRVVARAKAFAEGMGEPFAKALPEAFAKGIPNQEPEPEQEPNEIPTTSGAIAPSVDPDPIFGGCLAFLKAKGCAEKGARSFLALMRKEHGEAAVVQAIERAEREDVSEPIPWLRRCLDATTKPTGRRAPTPENFNDRNYGQGGLL